MANQETIKAFNKSRSIKNPSTLCYAPEISLNFDQTGKITACCFNRDYILGTYPEDSISEIWNGEKLEIQRKSLGNDSLKLGCQLCEKMLDEGNFESVLIRHFDDFVPAKGPLDFLKPANKGSQLPLVFEFELSNTCNLECIMCGGHWSSAIRKNREGLPTIVSPYDDGFVQQVREFLPSLKRANFLGGEPFLISIYYEIWESIIELNPGMEVAITSNGTTLTKRARNIIDKLSNLKITLSIDSISKSTYESIRVNADFDQVFENIQYLMEKGKLASFSVCPIIQNRYEIPEIIEFCETHGIDIFFNVVYEPLGDRVIGIHEGGKIKKELGTPAKPRTGLIPETSMQYLSVADLESLINYYEGFSFSGRYQDRLNGLIAQLDSWRRERTRDMTSAEA